VNKESLVTIAELAMERKIEGSGVRDESSDGKLRVVIGSSGCIPIEPALTHRGHLSG
jgi:DNA gyrase/topoisomerase IV subunit A